MYLYHNLFIFFSAFLFLIGVGMYIYNSTSHSQRMKKSYNRSQELKKIMFSKSKSKITTKNNKNFFKKMDEILNLHKFVNFKGIKEKILISGAKDKNAIYIYMFFQIVFPILLFFIMFFMVFYTNIFFVKSASYKYAILFSPSFISLLLPNYALNKKINNRIKNIKLQFPTIIDLMLVCVESGLSLDQSILKVSDEMSDGSPEMVEELLYLSSELTYLGDRELAFKNFADRNKKIEAIQVLSSTFIQADKYGTTIGKSLRQVVEDVRRERMAGLDKVAASIGSKITFPILIFIFPAMLVLMAAGIFLAH